MKTSHAIFLIGFFLFFFSACKKKNDDTLHEENHPKIVRVDDGKIKDGFGNTIQFKGICFGNEVWSNTETPHLHHNEEDFKIVKNMGMNCVRFYLNYKTFEDDATPYEYKQSGWDWLDQNIQWAKNNDIYLILNMHVPQGGFQSLGKGFDLWNDSITQDRLIKLWGAIAEHCKEESTIGGYGLVNEPNTSTSIDQWEGLANTLTQEIRKYDTHHLIIAERLGAVNDDWKDYNNDYNFIQVNDNNVAYEFHFYDPIEYTHQLASWINMPDGGKYPDDNVFNVIGNSAWHTATFNNPTLPAGTTDWTYYEGVKYKVSDSKIALAKPSFINKNNSGTVYFDSIAVLEYDANGDYMTTRYVINFDQNKTWWYWSADNSGSRTIETSFGYDDSYCLKMSGSTDDANASDNDYRFPITQNHSYQIVGYMKGENVEADADVLIRLDFESLDGSVIKRNKDYLAARISDFEEWGKTNNVPIYCGEFGLIQHCFENEKGGIQWVTDVLDIFEEKNIHYTYHVYHEDNFGLIKHTGNLPDTNQANKPLMNLFSSHIKK